MARFPRCSFSGGIGLARVLCSSVFFFFFLRTARRHPSSTRGGGACAKTFLRSCEEALAVYGDVTFWQPGSRCYVVLVCLYQCGLRYGPLGRVGHGCIRLPLVWFLVPSGASPPARSSQTLSPERVHRCSGRKPASSVGCTYRMIPRSSPRGRGAHNVLLRSARSLHFTEGPRTQNCGGRERYSSSHGW